MKTTSGQRLIRAAAVICINYYHGAMHQFTDHRAKGNRSRWRHCARVQKKNNPIKIITSQRAHGPCTTSSQSSETSLYYYSVVERERATRTPPPPPPSPSSSNRCVYDVAPPSVLPPPQPFRVNVRARARFCTFGRTGGLHSLAAVCSNINLPASSSSSGVVIVLLSGLIIFLFIFVLFCFFFLIDKPKLPFCLSP